MSAHLSLSVVIATRNRTPFLKKTLACLEAQTRRPHEVIVIDASNDSETMDVVHALEKFPINYLKATSAGAAPQRNQGIHVVQGDITVFMDDDIEFSPRLLETMEDVFLKTSPAAISPRMTGGELPPPSPLLKFYYHLQAGYRDETYGARLFGPAINTYPCYQIQTESLIPSEWLPSTCLFVKTSLLRKEQFPNFPGYSFAEDVHLSARLRRHAPLYFYRDLEFIHHSATGCWKSDLRKLIQGKLQNQKKVAREILGLSGYSLFMRMLLHRLFLSATVLRRPENSISKLLGIWS